MKVRCTLLALEYKSDVYVAWNSKIFPSETFDNVFSYQAELHKKPTLQLQLYEADSGLSLVNMAHDIQDETKSQGCSDINSGNTW
jgi:hypothetical protein